MESAIKTLRIIMLTEKVETVRVEQNGSVQMASQQITEFNVRDL